MRDLVVDRWRLLSRLLHLLNSLVLWMTRRSRHSATPNSGTRTCNASYSLGSGADGRTSIVWSAGNVRERVWVIGADRELAVDGDVSAGSSLSDGFLRAGRLQVFTLIAIFISVVKNACKSIYCIIFIWNQILLDLEWNIFVRNQSSFSIHCPTPPIVGNLWYYWKCNRRSSIKWESINFTWLYSITLSPFRSDSSRSDRALKSNCTMASKVSDSSSEGYTSESGSSETCSVGESPTSLWKIYKAFVSKCGMESIEQNLLFKRFRRDELLVLHATEVLRE